MLITIKFLRVMDSKFSKIHPLKCSNRGARARCAGAGSAFEIKCLTCKKLGTLRNVKKSIQSLCAQALNYMNPVHAICT